MALPEDDPPAAVPEWVVTYGDMMSLLLTFFIMLVSMSKLKEEGEVVAAMDAIRAAFGTTDGLAGSPGTMPPSTGMFDKLRSHGVRSEGGTKRGSRDASGTSGPNRPVDRISHGTTITLGGAAQFARFDVTLTDVLKRNLDSIARVLGPKPNRIAVRGHASPEPLPADFHLTVDGFEVRNPWDLSYARARAVADYLEKQGIDRRRLVVSAAGDTEPRAISRDTDGQQRNRRVDVFVIDAYITPPR